MRRPDGERFAISLVGLTLVRAGYELQKSVLSGSSEILDLIARKYSANGEEERFGIECKWVSEEQPLRIEEYRMQIRKLSRPNMPVELAVVIGNGAKVLVSPSLFKKMLYDESQMTVKELWSESAVSINHSVRDPLYPQKNMIEFNFKGLHAAFLEALNRHEPSIAFSLAEGRGRFVFLLFLTTDSNGKIIWGELDLFLLLARTQKMLRFRLLGNHKIAGDFKVRLKHEDQMAIRAELGIEDSATGPAFVLTNFLSKLNEMIPSSISLESKINVIKAEKSAIDAHCASYVDDASKVYLLKVAPLPEGRHPREETLRKLYMLDAKTADIASLIRNLKALRWTAYWTDAEPKTNKFAEIFAKVAGALANR